MTNSKAIDLSIIAARLEGLEETIINKLIDRAQFCENLKIYQPGQSGFTGEPKRCLFDIRLRFQEEMDSLFGRFCVPEERPFTENLPPPQRKVSLGDTGLFIESYDIINVTQDILTAYFKLIPNICKSGDDNQYGSSVEHDVYAVQAIARRIHYGALYVAESKFRDDPKAYTALIEKNDTLKIMDKLTRKEVEDRIISRVREKTNSIQASVNQTVRYVVDPQVIVDFYKDIVIPLTKKGEVLYLLNRRLS